MGEIAQFLTGPTAGRQLRLRFAESAEDICAAQRLRFQVFHQELGARLSDISMTERRDVDPYDAIADHLLVEHGNGDEWAVVGTYRLLRQPVAEARGGFYSSGEFDLSPLIEHAHQHSAQLLELGRSCVAPAFRDSATIQLLWRGIAHYLSMHDIGYMFGCASLPGTDISRHAAALSYLHHRLLAPQHLCARARGDARVSMNILPMGSYDDRLAARALPPLIKGYLRVGAMVGDGAWIDRDFGTTDIMVVMPVESIAARYSDRFSARIAA